MLIRPFKTGDEPDVVRVISTIYTEYGFSWEPEGYHADLYDLAAHYGGPNAGFWVLEDDHGVVQGTVALHFYPATDSEFDGVLDRIPGCDCGIDRMYLSREHRRKGWGEALFARAILEARAKGCQKMEIWSDKAFEQAHKLYQKHGTVPVRDRVLHTDPDKAEEWGLILNLSP